MIIKKNNVGQLINSFYISQAIFRAVKSNYMQNDRAGLTFLGT